MPTTCSKALRSLACTAALLSSPAWAQFSGHDLQRCMRDPALRDLCMMYVGGVADGLGMGFHTTQALNPTATYAPFCAPASITRQQIYGLARQHITRPQAALQLPAALLISEALATAYPCPQ